MYRGCVQNNLSLPLHIMNKRILFFIQQVGMLMQIPRTHQKNLGNTYDTVALHSYHSALIAYCLCRMEKLSHEDALKAMAMGLLHDLPEARTGDLDFARKNYSKVDEEKAIKDTYAGIPFAHDLEKIVNEYEERKSVILQCAKDADLIEQMYQEWVLMWQGNKLAQKWFEDKQKLTVPKLYTKSAKAIIKSIKTSNPQEWWWSEFVTKNYKSKNLTGR